jgi:2-keto-4-pentenoate hydratase/2-oxohepta-3-ene-1,7-dioic acid hydratase in catechol pathway
MKLIRFRTEDHKDARTGIMKEDGVHPFPDHVQAIDVIRAEDDFVASGAPLSVQDVRLRAPLHPHQIIAIGRNYASHAAEMQQATPDAPLIFAKLPSAVISTDEEIVWRASITQQVDWEGELGVIIGEFAKDISEADALDYVFGYTIANDITARDLQHRIDKQWTRAKSLDTFCPLGPVIVNRHDLPDPQSLEIVTRVNGQIMQQASTADMIYSVAQLVSYCSRMFTLSPGDLILTGTPQGVGAGQAPPRFLQDGDEVTVTIEGIGTLTNTCRVLA